MKKFVYVALLAVITVVVGCKPQDGTTTTDSTTTTPAATNAAPATK